MKRVDSDTVSEEELAEAEDKVGMSPDHAVLTDGLDTLRELEKVVNRHLAMLTPKEREILDRLHRKHRHLIDEKDET